MDLKNYKKYGHIFTEISARIFGTTKPHCFARILGTTKPYCFARNFGLQNYIVLHEILVLQNQNCFTHFLWKNKTPIP